MAVIAWVFGFLLLFSTMSYFRLEQFYSSNERFKVYLGKNAAIRNANLEALHAAVQLHKEEKGSKEAPQDEGSPVPEDNAPSEKKRVKYPLYLDFPPFNSKLNLMSVYEEYAKGVVETAPYLHLFARLLDVLYGEQPFYYLYGNTTSAIIENLMEKSVFNRTVEGKIELKSLSDLASIDFGNDDLQEIWYKMLKGCESRTKEREKGSYPSLFDFIILEKRRKFAIQIHQAPLELLTAVFNNSEVAIQIVAKREELHMRGRRPVKSRNEYVVSDLFLSKDDVGAILEDHHLRIEDYISLLDFVTNFRYKEGLSHNFSISSQSVRGSFTASQILPDLSL